MRWQAFEYNEAVETVAVMPRRSVVSTGQLYKFVEDRYTEEKPKDLKRDSRLNNCAWHQYFDMHRAKLPMQYFTLQFLHGQKDMDCTIRYNNDLFYLSSMSLKAKYAIQTHQIQCLCAQNIEIVQHIFNSAKKRLGTKFH